MAKSKAKIVKSAPPPPPIVINQDRIRQQLQQLKDSFAMNKGRSDQIFAESLKALTDGNAQVIQTLLQKVSELEEENRKLKNPPKEEPKK